MSYANLVLVFVQLQSASFLSILLNYITFQKTGVFFEGVKGTTAYWKNIIGDYAYRWNDFHIAHPWLYIIVCSFIFTFFCMGLTHFIFAISLYIKGTGLWIFVIAAGISLLFFELQCIGGYDVFGDICVYTNAEQSGVPTFIIWLIFFVLASGLLRKKQVRWEHEE